MSDDPRFPLGCVDQLTRVVVRLSNSSRRTSCLFGGGRRNGVNLDERLNKDGAGFF